MHLTYSQPKSILCIFSAGRSGSTLASLMIGSHPKCFYLGEFHALPQWVNENKKCGCGSTVSTCTFWRTIASRYRDLHGFDFMVSPHKLKIYQTFEHSAISKYIWKMQKASIYFGTNYSIVSPLKLLMKARWQTMVETTIELYRLVNEVSGCEVIVDSSKNYVRNYMLYSQYPALMKLIFLVRDGRAVCYSHMLNEGFSMEKAARRWRKTYVRGEHLLSHIPEAKKLFLRYEDLCVAPQEQVQRITDFLSLKFEPNMLDISSGLWHTIAGNSMKWAQNKSIKLNERWKTQLSKQDIDAFESIAGDLNQKFGYSKCLF